MKNKIISRFLAAYMPLILLAVIVLNFFVSFRLRTHFENKIIERLYSNSLLVRRILKDKISKNETEELQEEVQRLGSDLQLRITVIDDKGIVLGDSEKDPKDMEYHGNRPEIIEAMEKGKGFSKRYSDTLNYNMKYIALPVSKDGKVIGVIRLAIALNEVDEQIRVIYRSVLIGGIIAAFFMVIVGYFISKSITNPISEMRIIAEKISSCDFSHKIKIKSKDELGSLAISLNKMADNLQSQIQRLEKMNKMRTDFVANVSHELKTPLTSIKGYVETLQDGALEDKDNAEKFLQIIKKHVDSLTNIVNDLLSLSELELGKDRLEKKKLNIKDLLDEIILGFGHALKEKNLNIEFKAINEDLIINADKDKIEQVFVNIIDNATKYTDSGGNIKVNINKKDERIFVTIEDTGIGIPKSDLSRVFERFYRVDKARSREVGGTGLGLAIVKHIISLHDGEILIESELNMGTKIEVCLPRA